MVRESELRASEQRVTTKITALESELKTVRSRLYKLEAKGSQFQSVEFDPSSKGFQRLDTDDGTFLISLQDIKPYANGFRVSMSVGNPLGADYSGFKVHAEWGTGIDKIAENEEWPQHKNDFDFTEVLRGGTWNKIVLPLAPAKPEEIEYISISMDTPQVLLLRQR